MISQEQLHDFKDCHALAVRMFPDAGSNALVLMGQLERAVGDVLGLGTIDTWTRENWKLIHEIIQTVVDRWKPIPIQPINVSGWLGRPPDAVIRRSDPPG